MFTRYIVLCAVLAMCQIVPIEQVTLVFLFYNIRYVSFKWSLHWTPIFECLMTWLVAKNGHQKDLCYDKLGLCG